MFFFPFAHLFIQHFWHLNKISILGKLFYQLKCSRVWSDEKVLILFFEIHNS